MTLKAQFKTIIFLLSVVFAMQNIIAQENTSKFTKIKELSGIEEYLYVPNDMNLLLRSDIENMPIEVLRDFYKKP